MGKDAYGREQFDPANPSTVQPVEFGNIFGASTPAAPVVQPVQQAVTAPPPVAKAQDEYAREMPLTVAPPPPPPPPPPPKDSSGSTGPVQVKRPDEPVATKTPAKENFGIEIKEPPKAAAPAPKTKAPGLGMSR